MFGISAMRAGELVSLALAEQTATVAYLAGVGRVDASHSNAPKLCFLFGVATDQTMLPERKPAAQSRTLDETLRGFGDVEVFKDQNTSGLHPLAELLGDGVCESA